MSTFVKFIGIQILLLLYSDSDTICITIYGITCFIAVFPKKKVSNTQKIQFANCYFIWVKKKYRRFTRKFQYNIIFLSDFWWQRPVSAYLLRSPFIAGIFPIIIHNEWRFVWWNGPVVMVSIQLLLFLLWLWT